VSGATPERAAPFVVGAPRSGTTMLRLMLDAHPEIAIPAETHFYDAVLAVDETVAGWIDATVGAMVSNHCWGDFGLDADAFRSAVLAARPRGRGDVLRMFYRLYAERSGKRWWGDKWPGNSRLMNRIAEVLPEARFVHIVRDGRDVAASLRGRWWAPGETYEDCIRFWAERVRAARAQAAGGIPYLEVRYETLVREPEHVLRNVCAFIGFAYDGAMLGYAATAARRLDELTEWTFGARPVTREMLLADHVMARRAPTTERIGMWRSAMSPADAAACERVAGDLLRDLGYS
jgi:LPS sulfotransferase NodH